MRKVQLATSPSALEYRRTVKPRDSRAATRWRPRKPVAPVTRISSFIGQELLATIVKFIDGAHVIVDAANIQPVPGVSFHMHGVFTRQHVEHEVIETILLSRGYMIEQ